MRKLHLRLDDLAVETFSITVENAERGTVQGNQSGVETCATCVGLVCQSSRRQTPCCTNPEFNCSLPVVC